MEASEIEAPTTLEILALTEPARALVVDDDAGLAEGIRKNLLQCGYQVTVAHSGNEALLALQQEIFSVALIDVCMPGTEGLPLLRKVLDLDATLPVVLMTGFATVSQAVTAIREGAFDFIEKPLRREILLPLLDKAVQMRRMRNELCRMREELQRMKLPAIVGNSAPVRDMMRQINSVASTPHTTVLIQGESGTGKELAARAIHDASSRREMPFVAVNCAALTETLLEAELFGYEKGSFTGASSTGKQGLFCAAEGGTIFLDEISELAPGLQAKLLRTLQERTVRRVGGEKDLPVDVRVIASTNRDLTAAVNAGKFRQDLFFRLHVMSLELPALRERKDDIALLAHYFLEGYNRELGKNLRGFAPESVEAFLNYDWPGNVRELRNTIERASIVAAGPLIQPRDLLLRFAPNHPSPTQSEPDMLPIQDRSLRSMEKTLIEQVLKETRGNISRSASILGINRTTLYNKIRLYEAGVSA